MLKRKSQKVGTGLVLECRGDTPLMPGLIIEWRVRGDKGSMRNGLVTQVIAAAQFEGPQGFVVALKGIVNVSKA